MEHTFERTRVYICSCKCMLSSISINYLSIYHDAILCLKRRCNYLDNFFTYLSTIHGLQQSIMISRHRTNLVLIGVNKNKSYLSPIHQTFVCTKREVFKINGELQVSKNYSQVHRGVGHSSSDPRKDNNFK